jgi:hypothetical protein
MNLSMTGALAAAYHSGAQRARVVTEAWAKAPTGKKRETTHVVRCKTEIFRVNRL